MARAIAERSRWLGYTLLGVLLALTMIGSGMALASTTRTYRDNFDSVSYSGNNGTASWSGNWLESGESDGPANGRVRVVTHSNCVAGSCGRLTAGSNTTAGIHRRADLSGASSATLTFIYRRTKIGGSAGLVRVSVSADGGSSWSTLATYTLDATDGSASVRSFGITPYISTQTQVRFRVESDPGQSGTFHFDNVQIAANIPDATTTTTTTATTSTTSTTTTTTTPQTSTSLPSSSTTAPPSSTTTAPPSSTTSTSVTAAPTSTTTSEAPPSSTTEAAPATTPVAAGSPAPIPASSPFATPFPIRASEPVGGRVAPTEARLLNSTEPDVSGLVLAAMSEFAEDQDQPAVPEVDLLESAATGATAGAGSTVLTLMPVGLGGLGLLLGRLTRRRRR